MAISPDGRRFVSGGERGLYLWETESGRAVPLLAGQVDWVRSIVFSPDGRQLLVGAGSSSVRLWDIAGERLVRVFGGYSGALGPLAFSPDGQRVATVGTDYIPATGALLAGAELWDVPSGQRILTAACWGDHVARLWDVETGALLQLFYEPQCELHSAVFSPAGERVLLVGRDPETYSGTVGIWITQTAERVCRFEPQRSLPLAAFTSDGQRVLLAGMDGTIGLWDAATARPVRTYDGHNSEVHAVALSPDGRQVITASQWFASRLWDAQTGEILFAFEHPSSFAAAVAFSPNGEQALLGCGSYGSGPDVAWLWNVRTRQVIRTFEDHNGGSARSRSPPMVSRP